MISIIFSIILLPVNLCCAFWIFREALNLTGMTFKEFLETTSFESLWFNTGSRTLRKRKRFLKRQRFLVSFFKEKSLNPQKSIRLLWTFGICTLPGLAALTLAVYAASHIDKLKCAFTGNLILVAINISLVIWGKIYRKNHPLDDVTAEKLHAKRMKEKEYNRKNRVKSIIVYSLVGAFFFGILLFFMMGISNLSQSSQTAISTHADLTALLNEKGYETANIPTTYWDIDANKLLHAAAGVKGDNKFEFYGYSDDETVDLVYNQIVYLTAPKLKNSERESHETSLPDGNKMFTIVIDGVYYLVMYRNDTVIYAYSPDSLNEINEILTGIGYLKNR